MPANSNAGKGCDGLKLLLSYKWTEYIIILAGVSLMAAGVRFIYEPLDLVTGGVSGLAIAIRELSRGLVTDGIPVWITNGIINIPLFVTAWRIRGGEYIIKSLYATIVFTAELSVMPCIPVAGDDYVLAAIAGGVLTGTGIGLVILTGGSTGGTDLLCAIIRHYMPEKSIAAFLLYIDTAVVSVGAAVFGIGNALYAVIAVYITSRIMDNVTSGIHYSKLVMIITGQDVDMSDVIMRDVGRGVTSINARGMFSGADKQMMLCAASKREAVKIIRIVSVYAPDAFVMISDIKEVFGEGFVNVEEYLN